MKRILLTLAIAFAGQIGAQAQDGWNWPEDPDKKSKAIEKNALYSDMLTAENYEAAKTPLDWLLKETPDLNSSIYIQGVKVYENLALTATGERQKNLQDSTVLLYDLRMKYFNDVENVTNRKAYEAYTQWKERKDKYADFYKVEKEAFDMLGNKFFLSNAVPYMYSIRLHKLSGGDLSDIDVIDAYDKINSLLDYYLEQGEDPAKVGKYRDYIDQVFNNTVKIDCNIIDNQLYPKFKENKNVGDAKRIVKFALAGGCTSSEAFIDAAKYVIQTEPDFGISRLIAIRSKAAGDLNEAQKYFEQAITLTEDNIKQADIYVELADLASKRGAKSEARSYAYKALSADPSKKEAYLIIGDLYFGSGSDCREGKDMVKDRAVYIAAYNMYQKGGNASRMATAKEQFPSKEDIFNYNYNVGQELQVNCWIGETIKIDTRD
jgi:tetratricopeptide (TPR) repeat protein